MTDKRGGIIQVTLLCLLVIWTIICIQGVAGGSYGEGISTCPTRSEDLNTQICPRNDNDRKYVRIKTYNGKYLWAYPTNNGDNSYVRTRCCGKNDYVGRKDSTHPGTKTTFRVHCSSNKATVRFEVLTTTRNGVNRASGYYLYADTRYKKLYSERRPDANDRNSNFILKRWRGPVTAIKSAYNFYWWAFHEDGDGSVLISKDRVRSYPDFPPLYDAFTLELVPRECVEVTSNERIIAAQGKVTPEECHRKPDRCYWTDGWQEGTRRNIKEGTCYYMKDSMCYQTNIGSRRGCPQRGAKNCEAANCCFDYQRNQCYRGTA